MIQGAPFWTRVSGKFDEFSTLKITCRLEAPMGKKYISPISCIVSDTPFPKCSPLYEIKAYTSATMLSLFYYIQYNIIYNLELAFQWNYDFYRLLFFYLLELYAKLNAVSTSFWIFGMDENVEWNCSKPSFCLSL